MVKLCFSFQSLQRRWESFLSDASALRVALESQLLHWNEFDDGLRQIQRWLSDMDRKTATPEPTASLSERRAQLQKFKASISNRTYL